MLGNGFQHRQQLADVGDFLVDQQDVGVFQLDRHGVLIGDEVGREVATVELHAFDDFQLVFEAATFVNGDDAFFTYFLHRFGNDLANALVAVGRDGAYLGNGFGVGAGYRHCLDLFHRRSDRLVDAALKIHRVHTGSNAFQAFRDNRLSQNGGGGGAVTRSVRSF